jgi:antirestriction protein
MTNTNTRIYIANLGKYNEGELVGKWVELPIDEDDLNKVFAEIGLGYFDEDDEYHHGLCVNGIYYEEYAIHDFESDIDDFHIGEYEDIIYLSELIERVEDLDVHEFEAFQACREATGDSLEDCLETIEYGNFTLYSGMSLEEVAEEFVDEGVFSTETLLQYIDFERLGRDLGFDGYTETDYGVIQIY